MGTPLSGAPWMTQLPQFKPGIFAGLLHAQQNQIMQENTRRSWDMDDLNQNSQRTQNELEALKLAESRKDAEQVSPLARQDQVRELEKKDRLRSLKEEEDKAIMTGKIEQEKDNKRRRDAVASAEFLSRMDDDLKQDEGFLASQEKYLKYVEDAKQHGITLPAYWSPETKDKVSKAAELARNNLPGMRAKLDQEERDRIREMQKLAVQESTRAAMAREHDQALLDRTTLQTDTQKNIQEMKGQQALENLQYKLQNANNGKPLKMGELEAHALQIATGAIPSTPEQKAEAEATLKYIQGKIGIVAMMKMAQDSAIATNAGVGNLITPPAGAAAAGAIPNSPRAGQLPSTGAVPIPPAPPSANAPRTPTPNMRGSGPDSVPPMPTNFGQPAPSGQVSAKPENPLRDAAELGFELEKAKKSANNSPLSATQIRVLDEEYKKQARTFMKSRGVQFTAEGKVVGTPENIARMQAAEKEYEQELAAIRAKPGRK
jgi:hypothetical protein